MGLPNLSLAIISIVALSMAHYSLAQNFVNSHNKFRAQIGVPPLRWNCTLAAYATRYAIKSSRSCEMEHSMGPYGENLAMGGGEFSAADAVNMWAGEKANYDHRSNSCTGGECLHYTQVVWHDTKHLGCARVKCRNGVYFIICSYYPPGNYIGERPY